MALRIAHAAAKMAGKTINQKRERRIEWAPASATSGPTARSRGLSRVTERGNAPGVVVIQEWWGLQDQITGICDRLALAGYDALAPDLYGARSCPITTRTRRQRDEFARFHRGDRPDRTRRRAVPAKSNPRSGSPASASAARSRSSAPPVPELAAAVCFYGLPPETAAKPGDLKVPLQGHFANQDDWCTPEAVSTFEAGAKAAGKSHRVPSL